MGVTAVKNRELFVWPLYKQAPANEHCTDDGFKHRNREDELVYELSLDST